MKQEEGSVEDHGDELYCICRKTHEPGVLMIGCDKCYGWFHNTQLEGLCRHPGGVLRGVLLGKKWGMQERVNAKASAYFVGKLGFESFFTSS